MFFHFLRDFDLSGGFNQFFDDLIVVSVLAINLGIFLYLVRLKDADVEAVDSAWIGFEYFVSVFIGPSIENGSEELGMSFTYFFFIDFDWLIQVVLDTVANNQ